MTRQLITAVRTGLSCLALALVLQAAHAREILTLGVASDRPAAEMERRYQPLANYLTSQLRGTRVELLVLDQDGMESALKHNQVDFLLTNPSHYLELRSQNSFTGVLATRETLYRETSTTSLGGVIFTAAQRTDLTRIADLKGRRIAIATQDSLGDYQASALELLQAGVRLPGDVTLIELGSPDATVDAVLSGRADAGFIRAGLIEHMTDEGKLAPDRIKILNRQRLSGFPFAVSTRLYPEWPFVALPHVNEHAVRRVAAALLTLERHQPAAQAAAIAGFAPPADYLPVEQLAQTLRMPPYDTLPQFGWTELWGRYAPWIGGIAALLALLSMAAVWLVLLNRRVRRVLADLRESEQALRASYVSLQGSEQRLKQSQSIAHLGSWELDLVRNHLSWSDEVYRIFGLLPQESPATYEAFLEAVHPDDRQLVNDAYTSSLARGHDTYEVEHRIIRRGTGEIRFVHEKCQHLRDPSGKIIRSIGMVHDITERKQATVALQQRDTQLQTIIDVSPIPYAINDEKQNISYLNPAFTQTFGYDQRDIPTLSDWWPRAYPDAHYRDWVAKTWVRHLERAQQDGTPFEPMEIDIRCKDGGTRTVVASAVPLSEAFTGSHLVVLYDITERKRAEAEREKLQTQLLQTQKMESIGHLAGGIAHDFNNMLGTILGYAELIRQVNFGAEAAPERTQKYVGEILTAGNRAKELIAQMLVFSRLNPETNEGDAPITLLQPVVKEVVHLLRSSIPHTIDLNYQIADAKLRARIQPVHLHQILLNLAINARDAMGEYGRIDVHLARGAFSGACDSCHAPFDGDYVELSVRDTGKGIPAHLLTKIFDPFFTTKEVGKGTGMGLSVVHGIVHALGGHITVDSKLNQGTAVRVVLPALASDEATAPDQAPQPANGAEGTLRGLRIMVVDDEHAMASMLQELLTLHGAHASTYNLPGEALSAFVKNPNGIDLLITDETMPELSGLDMARAMLQIRPALPIILCTGHSEHVNGDIAKRSGIAAFLRKPVPMEELLALARDLTGKSA